MRNRIMHCFASMIFVADPPSMNVIDNINLVDE